MDKPFLTIDEQIRVLESRGCSCDKRTHDILLKEGYYPVVNGYREPFLTDADPATGHRRYVEGTTFDDIYRVFLFDRSLREVTFRYLTRIEAMLRNTCAYRFSERHPKPGDYLRFECYTNKHAYLGEAEHYEQNLEGLVNTLSNLSQDAESPKAGIRHYVNKHYGMPLWVVIGSLTFGNVRHLYDLLERDVQKRVCDDIVALVGVDPGQNQEHPITPAWLSRSLKSLVEARNICAHDDRLFNHAFADGELDFPGLLQVMDRLITAEESAERDRAIRQLADTYLGDLPQIRSLVEGKGLR